MDKEIIEKYTFIDWDSLSKHEILSESFIDKYQDKVNWYNISYNQKLSESFIEKYKDKLNLKCVLENQNL